MRPGSNGRRPRGRPNRKQHVNPRSHTFDSNGPDVRVRGNAHQVYERYLTLARDASSSGDRIMAEAYFQHAEHYFRILNDSTDPPRPDARRSDEAAEGGGAEGGVADGGEREEHESNGYGANGSYQGRSRRVRRDYESDAQPPAGMEEQPRETQPVSRSQRRNAHEAAERSAVREDEGTTAPPKTASESPAEARSQETEAPAEEAPPRPRRSRRARPAAVEETPSAEAGSTDSAANGHLAEEPKPAKATKQAEPVEEAPVEEEAPKPRRSRRRRVASEADETPGESSPQT